MNFNYFKQNRRTKTLAAEIVNQEMDKIKPTIISRRILLIGYWHKAHRIMTWLQQRRLVVPPELKTSCLHSQIGVAISILFGRKYFGCKTGLSTIFGDSEIVEATLSASRSFKPTPTLLTLN